MSARTALRLMVIAVVCCSGAARLGAQTRADSAALATTLAGVLRDSLLTRGSRSDAIIFRSAYTRFDTAVARALGLRGPVRRRLPREVDVYEVAIAGDTARVMVVETEFFAEPPAQLLFDEYQRLYVFSRSRGGWRFVRSQLVRRAVGGGVRGVANAAPRTGSEHLPIAGRNQPRERNVRPGA